MLFLFLQEIVPKFNFDVDINNLYISYNTEEKIDEDTTELQFNVVDTKFNLDFEYDTKNGKEIYIYKFRTMVENAEDLIKQFTPEQMEEFKTNFKLENDPRITKIGKFLRKTSFDELPQLLNIIKGELSIIGPRPVIAEELEKYGINKEKFLSVTPGLTGYWAANGRSTTTYEQRMEMELYYVDNMSFKLDLKIFFKTILSVMKKEGAI